MTLSPEEGHAISRLFEPAPTIDPLRRFVALYRSTANGTHLGAIAFSTQIAAWTKPTGPRVPKDLEILDVIEVRAAVPNGTCESP